MGIRQAGRSPAQAEHRLSRAESATRITVAVFRSVSTLQLSVVCDSWRLVTRRHLLSPGVFRWRGRRGGCCSDATGRGPDGGAAMLTSGSNSRLRGA